MNQGNRDNNGTSTTSGPIPPTGSEGSTGGTAANQGGSGPQTTGTVSGNNQQIGQRSSVGPTSREEELFRKGQELDRKIEEGICRGCTR